MLVKTKKNDFIIYLPPEHDGKRKELIIVPNTNPV